MTKTLIFGASGTVGSEIFRILSKDKQYRVYGVYNKNKPAGIEENLWTKCDMADIESLKILLESINPDIVISSLTGDFLAQSSAHRIITAYLKKNSGKIVYISTANVFDGDVRGLHSETTTPYPLSAYGSFKQSCEEMLLWGLAANCLVVRLPKILTKRDIGDTIKSSEEGQAVYANLHLNFNTAENVAKAIHYAIECNKSGILHLASYDYISIEEYMQCLLKLSNKSFAYKSESLNPQSYCAVFAEKDTTKLRQSTDGNYYLTISSRHEDINTKFKLSCKDAIAAVFP